MPMPLAELSRSGGIASLTLNRPEVLNAIDVPMARAIGQALTGLDGDESVRCIVLRGAGRAFIAGGDLARFADDFDQSAAVVDELLDTLHPAIELLRRSDAPVIAAVQGVAAGAGLSLMCACDLVIAAEDCRFLVAYDRIGAAPDCGGTWFLPRLLGTRKAAEFMFLGEAWNAQQALAAGLLSRIVPAAELEAQTLSMAARIAAGPTKAYGAYKRLAADSFANRLDVQLESERAAFKAATRTADFREGVGAFLAKKKPYFRGR